MRKREPDLHDFTPAASIMLLVIFYLLRAGLAVFDACRAVKRLLTGQRPVWDSSWAWPICEYVQRHGAPAPSTPPDHRDSTLV